MRVDGIAASVIPERPKGESGTHESRLAKVVFIGFRLPLRSSRNNVGGVQLKCDPL
jgi:hypothetical protein